MSLSNISLPEFSGKGVLITGASTGIGAELARAFAAQGAKIGLHYNSSKDAAEALAAEIEAAGGTVELVRADASNSEELAAAVQDVAERLGGLYGLINNAGGMVRRVPYEEVTDKDYDEIMDLNARSIQIFRFKRYAWCGEGMDPIRHPCERSCPGRHHHTVP
jgi:3-oxoacyl-[acyl-carrier protein] reductase